MHVKEHWILAISNWLVFRAIWPPTPQSQSTKGICYVCTLPSTLAEL